MIDSCSTCGSTLEGSGKCYACWEEEQRYYAEQYQQTLYPEELLGVDNLGENNGI